MVFDTPSSAVMSDMVLFGTLRVRVLVDVPIAVFPEYVVQVSVPVLLVAFVISVIRLTGGVHVTDAFSVFVAIVPVEPPIL